MISSAGRPSSGSGSSKSAASAPDLAEDGPLDQPRAVRGHASAASRPSRRTSSGGRSNSLATAIAGRGTVAWRAEAIGQQGQGLPRRDHRGFEVLVGKGDAENDALTFGVAEPRDFWLHVAGPPGSHVVVRNPDELDALPRPCSRRAAELAAWHSKARGRRGKVEVHVCRVADVSKPRGFDAGPGPAAPLGLGEGLRYLYSTSHFFSGAS